MRDDDFDQQRPRGESLRDLGPRRERVPGKQTLAEGARHRELAGAENVPGKRTLAEALDTPTQDVADSRDPVTETQFHVRKARELIGKLRETLTPTQGASAARRSTLSCRRGDAQCASCVLAPKRARGRDRRTAADRGGGVSPRYGLGRRDNREAREC